MFVLDTCIISHIARVKGVQAVKDWNDADRSRLLAMPAAVIVELQRGIEILKPKERQRAEELESWLDFTLASGMVVLPMDTETARLYGKMTAVPALRCLWVPDPAAKKTKLGQDLLIAATAIVHSATLVSLDLYDFARIHRHFPLPGFVCPGREVDLDAFRPQPSRRRERKARRSWESIPRHSVSVPGKPGSNPSKTGPGPASERGSLCSWMGTAVH